MIRNVEIENLRGGNGQHMFESPSTLGQRRLQKRVYGRTNTRQMAECRVENGAHQRAIGFAQLAIGRVPALRIEHSVQRRLAVHDRRQDLGSRLAALQAQFGRGIRTGPGSCPSGAVVLSGSFRT